VFFKIIFSQARYRWVFTLLLFLAMTVLVTLYVYLLNTNRFTNRAMQLVMKNMGHNMFILPETANPLDTFLCTEHQPLFEDETTHKLAEHLELFSRYYVSVLQQRCALNGADLLLTGIEPVERTDETSEKGNMMQPVPPGTVRLGHAAAKSLGLQEGAELELLGKSFRVEKILQPQGTERDYRIYLALNECQTLLGLEGRINAIWAFQCLHHGGPLQEIEDLHAEMLAKALPGFRHISIMPIARGRYLARETTSKTLYYVLGIVLGATVLIIAIAGMQEVTERRREVGILVAMGAGLPYIAGLYLVKISMLAAAAAVTGFLIGSELAVRMTASFLVTQTRSVRILWGDLPSVTLLSVAVALAAMLLPMIQLIRTDPSKTLVDE
jgi:ABC-type lipoprotein release transport system permease subunit